MILKIGLYFSQLRCREMATRVLNNWVLWGLSVVLVFSLSLTFYTENKRGVLYKSSFTNPTTDTLKMDFFFNLLALLPQRLVPSLTLKLKSSKVWSNSSIILAGPPAAPWHKIRNQRETIPAQLCFYWHNTHLVPASSRRSPLAISLHTHDSGTRELVMCMKAS